MDAVASVLRDRMIDELKRKGLGMSPAVERALRAIPRDLFLPEVPLDRVYSGDVIPTKRDEAGTPISSSSEVGVMAVMADQLALEEGQRVLEIGAGTGYNASLLASLAGERGHVTTVDLDADTAEGARRHLAAAGFPDVAVHVGDGWLGHAAAAPYDRIELTASSDDISPHWVEQVTADGILLVPLRLVGGIQALFTFRKDGRRLVSVSITPGGFMPLRGPSVGHDERRMIGEYEIETGTATPAAIDLLAALLERAPQTEIGPAPLGWVAQTVFSVSGADIVAVRRKGQPATAIGVIDADVPAFTVVETAGSAVSGPFLLLTTFGPASASARVRERLDAVRARTFRDLTVTAAPTEGGSELGGVVLRRRHYTFSFERKVNA